MRENEQYPIDILTAFAERTVKRLWIIIILLIVLLVATNAGWIWYNAQFEDVTTTIEQEVEQDADSGNNSFVGGDYYGEADGQDNGQGNDQNP